jgi:hypothetical protein
MPHERTIKLLDILELKEVITSPDLSTTFSYPKSGFLSLVKNYYKRTYFIELYSASIFKNRKSDNQQACCNIKVIKFF